MFHIQDCLLNFSNKIANNVDLMSCLSVILLFRIWGQFKQFAPCTHSRPFLVLKSLHQWAGWRWQGVVRGHSQDSWLQQAQRIFQTIWPRAQHIEQGWWKRKQGVIIMTAFVFTSHRDAWWSLAFLRMNTCLLHGNKWMNLFYFACTCIFCLISQCYCCTEISINSQQLPNYSIKI